MILLKSIISKTLNIPLVAMKYQEWKHRHYKVSQFHIKLKLLKAKSVQTLLKRVHCFAATYSSKVGVICVPIGLKSWQLKQKHSTPIKCNVTKKELIKIAHYLNATTDTAWHSMASWCRCRCQRDAIDGFNRNRQII